MESRRKDWTSYLKDYKHKKPPIPRSFKPVGNRSIAQILANWFNQLVEGRGDIPDKDGSITFEVPYRLLLNKVCVGSISRGLRNSLKKYGFTLKKTAHNSMEVTKHS